MKTAHAFSGDTPISGRLFLIFSLLLFAWSHSAVAQLPLTGDYIDSETRNLVVLIHGWNPENAADKYEESDGLYYLRNILTQSLGGSDWKLAMFHWEGAAATGTVYQDTASGQFNADNATKAAEAALIQGDYLALLLKRSAPELRQVHLIAHSAGTWAAKRALEGLLKDNPYVVVQVTLLDPFIPDAIPFRSHAQSVSSIASLASTTNANRIYRLENYFADDGPGVWNPFGASLLDITWPTVGTQSTFPWRPEIDINQQVDWGTLRPSAIPLPTIYSHFYDYHGGPLEFYADTVKAAIHGEKVEAGLGTTFEGIFCPFNYRQIAWSRGLFEESIYRPLITREPVSLSAQTGETVFLEVLANRATNYEWFKIGQPQVVGTGSKLSLIVNNQTAGKYIARVSNNDYGLIFSEAVEVLVNDSSPTDPSSLSVVAVSSSQINLTWRDNSADEAGFKIERRLGSAGAWTQIATRPANVTSYSDTVLAAGTAYSYQVRAYNAVGDSEYTTIASATTQAPVGTTFTLTISSSNPSSGVSVNSFVGSGSFASGTTPTSRSFASGTSVGVTCPSTLVGGLVFQKWQLNGSDFSFSPVTTVFMNGAHTLTAIFGSSPPPPRVLASLTVEGPSSVDERTSGQYRARGTFTDGSSAYLEAEWDENTSYATISSTGLLDTDAVSRDREIEVEAAVTIGGVTTRDTKSVTIRNTDEVATFTLTLNTTTGGRIGYSPKGNSYADGTVVSLHANEDDGYVFSHWTGDVSASDTDDDITVRMNRDRSVTAHFAVDTAVGNIRVDIAPPQAVAEDAAWKYRNYTAWRDSGNILDGIPPGSGYVNFKDIPGWIKPDSFPTNVIGGETTVVSGAAATYREILGAVQVTLSPAQAGAAGARWRLDDGPWTESGVTLANASTGNHTVQFLQVPGWTTPASQTVSVARGLTTTSSAEYGPPAGFPIITSVSPRTGPLAGGTTVTIEGANFQPGATVSFGGVAATTVIVVSPSKITAVTPSRPSYGSVPLVVTSGGQMVTQGNGFSYLTPQGQNIELVSQIGGNVEAVAVAGKLVCYGEGTSLVVMDITDSTTPVERGRIALPNTIRDLAISGTTAYAACASSGIYAVNITSPTAPSIVGFFQTVGGAYGVKIDDNKAYVGSGESGFTILDVHNPAAMFQLGSLDTEGTVFRIDAGTVGTNRYAFLAEYNLALRIVRVTDPGLPVEIATITAEGGSPGFQDVKTVGTKLYAAEAGRIRIFDLSNPAAPLQTGVAFNVGFGLVDVVGARLYTCSGTISVRDLTTTPDVTELGRLNLGGGCRRLVVEDGLGFAAMNSDGLKIVSVSDPASMVLRSSVKSSLTGVNDVKVLGGIAYVGTGDGLHTLDVSNPARPVRMGHLDGPRVSQLVVANGKSTMVDAGSKTVRIADVAIPSAPSLLGTYTGVEAYGVALLGNATVLTGASISDPRGPVFDVLNLDQPSSPQSAGSLALDPANVSAFSVAIISSWAFVQTYKELDVINLLDPSSPEKVGSVRLSSSDSKIAASVDGNFVYVPIGPAVQVVDVTVKTAPALGQTVSFPVGPYPNVTLVHVDGHRLYSNSGGFVSVYDISQPASPRLIAYYNTPGSGYGFQAVGELIFIADGAVGMSVLRLKDVDKPTVAITTPTSGGAYATESAILSLAGSATDDKTVTRVSWVNDRGGGGIATGTTSWQIPDVQLAAGVNLITVTAEDANGNLTMDSLAVTAALPDTTAPVVFVTGPKPDDEFAVSTDTIALSGSVADNQTLASVTWTSGSGGSGSVTLTGQTWTVANLPLVSGPNVIRVTATDAAGNSASDTAVVFLVPPDTTAPLVTIDFPTANAVLETQAAELNLSGLASDAQGVLRVEWSDGRVGWGVASGTAPWSVNGIALQPGLNVIEITAFDAAGNTSSDTLAVTYAIPAPRLGVSTRSNGELQLEVSGTVGSTWTIQASPDLSQWLPFTNVKIPAQGSVSVSDTPADSSTGRYYRAITP